MCSDRGDWTCLQPGFPIRKSSDHSLVIDSPRLIADSYVLLRFLVPRHPPCALKNLSHKDARVHCVVLKVRAAPHRGVTPTVLGTWFVTGEVQTGSPVRRSRSRPSLQDPTTCQALPAVSFRSTARGLVLGRRTARQRQLIDVPPLSTCRGAFVHGQALDRSRRPVLLRKEVIQPHLPVRLPCYDLVPIASPTFDGSLHKGWATGFGCYRLS